MDSDRVAIGDGAIDKDDYNEARKAVRQTPDCYDYELYYKDPEPYYITRIMVDMMTDDVKDPYVAYDNMAIINKFAKQQY